MPEKNAQYYNPEVMTNGPQASRGDFGVFFFQAEDGIRDANVTGVQTCALPLSCPTPDELETHIDHAYPVEVVGERVELLRARPGQRVHGAQLDVHGRHVQAGVGKEVAGGEEPAAVDLGDLRQAVGGFLHVDAEHPVRGVHDRPDGGLAHPVDVVAVDRLGDRGRRGLAAGREVAEDVLDAHPSLRGDQLTVVPQALPRELRTWQELAGHEVAVVDAAERAPVVDPGIALIAAVDGQAGPGARAPDGAQPDLRLHGQQVGQGALQRLAVGDVERPRRRYATLDQPLVEPHLVVAEL